MSNCIYCSSDTTNNKSREHIIPAAIGGKTTLDSQYVCSECNNIFSVSEMSIIREGPLSTTRSIIGPGKEEVNLRINKKGNISLCKTLGKNNEYQIGYLSMGQPILIPQITNQGKDGYGYELSIDNSEQHNYETCFQNLFSFVEGESKLKVNYSNKLRKGEFIFGYDNRKKNVDYDFILFINDSSEKSMITEKISIIMRMYRKSNNLTNINISKFRSSENKVVVDNKIILNAPLTAWFYFKVFFNFLIYLVGDGVLLLENIEEIQKYILSNGKTRQSFIYNNHDRLSEKFNINIYEHYIHIDINANYVFGFVFIYGIALFKFRIRSNYRLHKYYNKFPEVLFIDISNENMLNELNLIGMLKYKNLIGE